MLLLMASGCSTTPTESQVTREIRPRLAQLRQGMSEDQVSRTLQLSLDGGFGFLHEWSYICDLGSKNILIVSMTPQGTNGLFFEHATLRVPGRREESWPR